MGRTWRSAYVGVLVGVAFAGGERGRAGTFGRVDMSALETPLYRVEGDAFVRHGGDRFCNRPLYCNHISAVAFGGDKPYAMVGSNKTMLGNLMIGVVRQGKGKWLMDASDITAKYRPGRMEWIVKDASWGETTVRLEVVPTAEGPGMAARMQIEKGLAGDEIVWASGSVGTVNDGVLKHWDMTVPSGEPLLKRGFVPGDCGGDTVQVGEGDAWSVDLRGEKAVTNGRCSVASKMVVADASEWKDPAALLASRAKGLPICCGAVAVDENKEVYWSVRGASEREQATPVEEFAAGMKRVEAISHQVVVDTPDLDLNVAVGASCSVTDGVFRGNMYTHAGMRWGVPLLGWRTIFGGTVYGWHDNVKTQAKACIAKQVTESDRTTAKADPAMLLTSQAPDSRLFGKGRIDFHQPYHYDMQSQFFDQIQHAWRWTGDEELQKLLRPSLDLHCEYLRECFDPAGLGIYESYANTWPTDDQWYNGGGTSEETAYAYRAEETALLLAKRAGDEDGARLHEAAMGRIRKGFFDLLWIPERGYPGAFREQGGLKRLHESCWLYSIFCPIDAGLLDTEQAAQALAYTETDLERIKLPYGGEQCWPSNWVPSIWSVREMWPGDNYQLALAYFQTGLPEEGWSLLHGTFPQQMFYGTVPADLGHPAGATDFNDCASMFARTVVEGLFGYAPDYPNGVVRISPEFPSAWDHASIKTPDVSIGYHREGVWTTLKVTLAKAGDLEVRVPVSTSGVEAVTVNGVATKWEVVPGFGRSLVKVLVAHATAAEVVVTCRDEVAMHGALHISGNSGEQMALHPAPLSPQSSVLSPLIDFHDPQHVLRDAKIVKGELTGVFSENAGDHEIFILVQQGELRQWQIVRVHVTDAKRDAETAAKCVPDVPKEARWEGVDMQHVLNGDIRTIYQQKYLSPRPNTCSLRLATDGYSTWQMVLDKKNKPPAIDLANVPSLLVKGGDRLMTGVGVPFLWPAEKNNIAFTSRWDNWPKEVEVPVNKSGEVVWFLLCGTTNSMEVRIANAELRMKYADGVVEKLEIVPPFNFWSLCAFGGADYSYKRDGFALPRVPPGMVQLGNNCRAMVLNWRLRKGVALESVTLETLSEQVVVGLMGVTVMDGAR